MKIVRKPWGKEVWLELNHKFCYKRLYINKGYRTSFQYHQYKLETTYVISGIGELWLEDTEGTIKKHKLGPGATVTILPGRKHRIVALTNLILQEVSTPEVDDVIRIEDDTGRCSGRIESEHVGGEYVRS
jgi:mannose-6-phosphate isomerase-like protein (cupin superfamily)